MIKWSPMMKGKYNLYVNGRELKYPFVVLANKFDVDDIKFYRQGTL